MKVTLDNGEMAVAHHVATLRRCVNQSVRVVDQRRDSTSQAITLDIIGAVSELAFAKFTGTYPDLSVVPRHGGADFVIDGKRYDVKSTTRRDGRLLATTTKDATAADYYVLGIVDENVVDFVGYATSDDLLSKETITDLGHGPTHALPQFKLRRFKQDRAERN